MNKLKEMFTSKKFLVTVSGVIVVVSNSYFGMHLSNNSVLGIVTMVVTYVVGQSHVDGKKANK